MYLIRVTFESKFRDVSKTCGVLFHPKRQVKVTGPLEIHKIIFFSLLKTCYQPFVPFQYFISGS